MDRDIFLSIIAPMMALQLGFTFLIHHIVGRMSSAMMHLLCMKTGEVGIDTSCPAVTAAMIIIGYLVMISRMLMVKMTITTARLIIIR